MTPQQELEALRTALEQVRAGSLALPAFSALAARQPNLAAALPERFSEVLGQLLNRLESAALFQEESCSFSQSQLLDSLALWVDKAAQHLAQG